MELPKHTTQVGTIAANKKLYLEDYCISYMKQLGEMYSEDRKQIALFGIIEKERSVEYALVYGAAMLGMGKGRTDSLTNSQKEEAESFREEYFPDYQLLGVVVATDAVDENVYWLGNGTKTIPLDGYYIFYDKNEAMLNFMMHNQKEERGVDLDPVIVKKADMDREKREKKEKEEQELARKEAEKKSDSYRQKLRKADRTMRPERHQGRKFFPAAACLLILAIVGIYGVKQQNPQSGLLQPMGAYVSSLWNKASVLSNGYLGDDSENTSETRFLVEAVGPGENLGNSQESVGLVTGNSNVTAKNDIPVVSTEVQQPAELDVVVIPELDQVEGGAESAAGSSEKSDVPIENTETAEAGVSGGNQAEETLGNGQQNTQESQQPADNPQKYLIKKGDSLLRILRSHYGDESRLGEICDVNGIVDPNNIQVGQIILLP